jgi:uncharacterized protein with PIN domain
VKASFSFVGELNELLPHNRKDIRFTLEFAPHQSLKHLIESLSVPHTEIGEVLVNGEPMDVNFRLHEGDQVVVYPADSALEGEACFLLDNHLGQLATYLRMLGFDCLYRNDYQDEELARVSVEEQRVLLTRDRRLLMRKAIRHGYCIHQTDPRRQAGEVLRRFKLLEQVKPFQRCLRCNSPLKVVNKDDIIDRLELLTKIYYDEFRICPACNRIFWKGSHYEHMLKMITDLAKQAE